MAPTIRATIIRIRGVVYPSITDAARGVGVAWATVAYALDHGTLEECGIEKTIKIRGVEYSNMRSAQRALGVSHQAIGYARDRGTLDNVGLRKAKIAELKC